MPRQRCLLPLLLLTLAGPVLADTFRCNSKLVSQGDHAAEVLEKCGEPANHALVGYKEVMDDWGFWHEVQVEEWTYGPDRGMYRVLRFEGNRLVNVDSYRGG